MKAIVMTRIALAPIVAAARVVEHRVRTSPRMIRPARDLLAMLARRSKEARAFVRLRVMPLV